MNSNMRFRRYNKLKSVNENQILHDVDEALLVPKRLHTIRSVINNVGPLDETLVQFIKLCHFRLSINKQFE